jgi:S1-C subfamily serine protease
VIVAARAGAAGAEYGLQAGDIIFSVNGTPVRGLDDLRGIIAKLPANAPCALQVQRQGELFFLSFELE